MVCSQGSDESPLFDELWPRVYGELRQLAARILGGEAPGHTLQPTALVHEVYMRLVGLDPDLADEDGKFFAVAGRAMRQVLIDHARSRSAEKRGGDRRRESLVVQVAADEETTDDWLVAVDEALRRLEAFDPQLAQLVDLRYFAGLTFDQSAAVLQVAPITAKRMWKLAKGWLHREMEADES